MSDDLLERTEPKRIFEAVHACLLITILALSIASVANTGNILQYLGFRSEKFNLFEENLLANDDVCEILKYQKCDSHSDCTDGVDEDRCTTIPDGYDGGSIRVYNMETDLHLGICYDEKSWDQDMSDYLCQEITNRHYTGTSKTSSRTYLGRGISVKGVTHLEDMVRSSAARCESKQAVVVICQAMEQISSEKDTKKGRIVGGNNGDISDFPWQVAIVTGNGQLLCGGTFIGGGWVVTAAHCIKYPDIWNCYVVGGLTDITGNLSANKLAIEDVHVYPFYNPRTIAYDVAIIKVSGNYGNIGLTSAVLPAPGQKFIDGLKVNASGWGSTSYGEDTSNTLQYAELYLLNTETCRTQTLHESTDIKNGMICGWEINRDSCQGDSGGPLVAIFNDATYLIGITSWGKGCGTPGYPGVYTEVSFVVDWIIRKTS